MIVCLLLSYLICKSVETYRDVEIPIFFTLSTVRIVEPMLAFFNENLAC